MNYTCIAFSAKEFKKHVQNSVIYHTSYETTAGTIHVYATDLGIFKASFAEHTFDKEVLHNTTINMNKLVLVGTAFQIKVWQELLKIPAHNACSYQTIAHNIGKPTSWRAVGNAVGKNNIAYFIPCHRVIRSNGSLGGYRWGIEKKKILINSEGPHE